MNTAFPLKLFIFNAYNCASECVKCPGKLLSRKYGIDDLPH